MSRVAIVHDYLSQFGGAERVAAALATTFDAPIYTSLYQPDLTFEDFQHLDVRTTWLQRFVPQGRFRWAAPFLGSAFAGLDLSEFDTVIVSSSGFAHHVQHPNAYVYCHTAPRFIYDVNHYFGSSRMLAAATRPFLPALKRSDRRAAMRQANYAANSTVTAKNIERLYDKSAPIIYPPLHTEHLPQELTGAPSDVRALVVARLQPYKRIDLAIEACNRARIPLTIAGTGLDEHRLRSMASEEVHFLGRVPDDDLAALFDEHSIVLVPGIEDFGLAPVEANYAGRPVLARAAGGSLETTVDGVTGKLVPDDDADTWAKALLEALDTRWNPEALRSATVPFQLPAFQARVKAWVGGE